MRSASTWGVASFCVEYLGNTPDYPSPTTMPRGVPRVIRIGSKSVSHLYRIKHRFLAREVFLNQHVG
jgi:hypothetical protein